MFKPLKNKNAKHAASAAQTFVEYTLLIGVLVTMFIAATPLMKRGISAMIKLAADHVGVQEEAEQLGGDFGILIGSNTDTASDKTLLKWQDGVQFATTITDTSLTNYIVVVNQGFAERKTREQ